LQSNYAKSLATGRLKDKGGLESFDKMLNPKVPDVEDVSKMLANGGDLNGGADGIRTHYLLTASQTLSRLSYSPTPKV
jgi:hypothetical protein